MTAEELADAAAADGLEDDMLDDETFGADFDQGESPAVKGGKTHSSHSLEEASALSRQLKLT